MDDRRKPSRHSWASHTNSYEARLRGLSHQQPADRLNWLSWYQPGIFTALIDYVEFSDNLAVGTDPIKDPDPDDLDYGEEHARCAQRRMFARDVICRSTLL